MSPRGPQHIDIRQPDPLCAVPCQCARRWVNRFRAEGWAGLHDRSTRPHRQPHPAQPPRAAAVGLRPEVVLAQGAPTLMANTLWNGYPDRWYAMEPPVPTAEWREAAAQRASAPLAGTPDRRQGRRGAPPPVGLCAPARRCARSSR
ncbi:leucine zipper domain-containing protein [Streptomyces sp. NPDC005722]